MSSRGISAVLAGWLALVLGGAVHLFAFAGKAGPDSMAVGLPLPLLLLGGGGAMCLFGWMLQALIRLSAQEAARVLFWTLAPYIAVRVYGIVGPLLQTPTQVQSPAREEPAARESQLALPLDPFEQAVVGDWAEFKSTSRAGGGAFDSVRLEVLEVGPREVGLALRGPKKSLARIPRRPNCRQFLDGLGLQPELSGELPRVQEGSGTGLSLPGQQLPEATVLRLSFQVGNQDEVKLRFCDRVRGIGLVSYFYRHTGNGRAEEVWQSLELTGFGHK